MLASFFVRLRAMVNRRAADADLDDELRYHLEREIGAQRRERDVARATRVTPLGARSATRPCTRKRRATRCGGVGSTNWRKT